ncbi:MAG: YIP1 family protein [Dehalococcoidia bacterium]|nr:MAG: YIP1 family protein [Dehalococcoidia bacterium]
MNNARRNGIGRLVGYFCGTIASPRKTFQRILNEKSILVGLAPVIVFGSLAAITYFVSYLYGASTTLEEVYAGSFFTERFIPIPKDTYRLWEALFILPMYLTGWILLAGFARLVAKPFGGKGSFKENLERGSPFLESVIEEGVVLYDDGTFEQVRRSLIEASR